MPDDLSSYESFRRLCLAETDLLLDPEEEDQGQPPEVDEVPWSDPPADDADDPGWLPPEANDGSADEAVWSETAAWEEADIPPRPWLAPGYLMRGTVTVLAGGSGVSKSMVVLAHAVSLALGRQLHGFRPAGTFRSVVYNVEDDAAEQRRRLSAALTSIGHTPSDIAGRVFRTGPSKLGALFVRDPIKGTVQATPALDRLKEIVKEKRIDALFVDPLAELHNAEENSNEAMRAIAAEFRLLAVDLEVAVCIVHHARKGQHAPGDPEASRGASSLIGAARTVLTVTGMTPEEGTNLGLGAGAHRAFFRLDGGKANHAPLTECEWFERVGYSLVNGDTVAAVVPWTPPADTVNLDTRIAIEAGVAAGSLAGPWSAKLSSDARSIKALLERHGVTTLTGQKTVVANLQASGFEVAEFRRENRVLAQGFRSPDGRPSNVNWTSGGGA